MIKTRTIIMYIPKINQETDEKSILEFMNRFPFAIIINAEDNIPLATHLPFLISKRENKIILTSHFAKANNQWAQINQQKSLIIFSEPHAYISPSLYDSALNVPTWNYMTIHAYGVGKIIEDQSSVMKILEDTIDQFERQFHYQWDQLPSQYKNNLANGIVAFEIEVTELQAKKKLSQNKNQEEKNRIISALSMSNKSNELHIAEYMKKENEK